jgi:hypothetical protein
MPERPGLGCATPQHGLACFAAGLDIEQRCVPGNFFLRSSNDERAAVLDQIETRTTVDQREAPLAAAQADIHAAGRIEGNGRAVSQMDAADRAVVAGEHLCWRGWRLAP